MKALLKWTIVAFAVVVGYTLYIALKVGAIPDIQEMPE